MELFMLTPSPEGNKLHDSAMVQATGWPIEKLLPGPALLRENSKLIL